MRSLRREMTTSGRSVAYIILSLAALFGGGSLMAFLVFLLAGSPELPLFI